MNLRREKTYGLRVETRGGGGRVHHEVSDIGVGPDRVGALSQDVVNALRGTAEIAWGEIPEGSGDLVITVTYRAPRQPKVSQ